MKAKVLFVILLISISSLLGDTIIKSFEAYSREGKIVLEWMVQNEDDVNYYQIQRSMDRGNNYYDLSKIAPYGSGVSYLFIDENVLGAKSDMTYTYRLKIFFNDRSEQYSYPVEISLNISSVEMTWGSIKAMFR
ncbi:hypothetical protein KAJ27_08235 [bacterium]|nr:hypothetical protein [Candidatus Neomarinimicrobiota bacterium]MCK5684095.1 hypothetical protein [bacterium]